MTVWVEGLMAMGIRTLEPKSGIGIRCKGDSGRGDTGATGGGDGSRALALATFGGASDGRSLSRQFWQCFLATFLAV